MADIDASIRALLAALSGAQGGVAVTKSDTVNIPGGPVRALYVGTSGDVAVVFPDGSVITHKAVPAGAILDVAAVRVNATNTTAADLVGWK